jgi:hypothetical protein
MEKGDPSHMYGYPLHYRHGNELLREKVAKPGMGIYVKGVTRQNYYSYTLKTMEVVV